MTTVCSLGELDRSTDTLQKCLDEGDMVITNGGKPLAVVMTIGGYTLDRALELLNRTRAGMALESIWADADKREPMSEEQIEAVIQESRKERREREQKAAAAT